MKTIFALFFKYEFIAFSDFCHRNQRGWIGRTIDHVLYIKVYSLSKGFEKTTYMCSPLYSRRTSKRYFFSMTLIRRMMTRFSMRICKNSQELTHACKIYEQIRHSEIHLHNFHTWPIRFDFFFKRFFSPLNLFARTPAKYRGSAMLH